MSLPARIFRLSRAQFLPVILSPILVGSVLPWWTYRAFNVLTFGLVVLGSVTAHLAANTIDDAYDYASGVDVVSNSMFPPDFGGWKPLPRGFITFGHAKLVAYLFFSVTILVGLYLTMVAGPLVLLLGAVGIFFAYFHVAPPLRLGYRGLGLGEIGIFLSFGVLPVIRSFYVQSSYVSTLSLITGMPLGLLTTSVLINHDQIFYDPYLKAEKRSFTVTVGRKPAMTTALILTLLSYAIVLAAALGKLIPITTLLVFLTLPLFIMQTKFYTTPAQSPLHYVKLTQTTFALSVIFGVLLALGLAVG
jgi:1,4-dihydroxy-2-naphthoate octaprenyltransferase